MGKQRPNPRRQHSVYGKWLDERILTLPELSPVAKTGENRICVPPFPSLAGEK